jgi:cell division protein FtsI/penicillin-binding protein 2
MMSIQEAGMTIFKTHRIRMALLVIISVVTFLVIEIRLFQLQVIQSEDFSIRARNQQNRKFVLNPRRGDILDRKGNPLATSYLSDTMILSIRDLDKHLKSQRKKVLSGRLKAHQQLDVKALFGELAGVTGHTQVDLLKMREKKREHILIRKAPEKISDRVKEIETRYKLPPNILVYRRDSKRSYPNGRLASHVLGFTKIDDSGDNIGLEGLELIYDDWLKGDYRDLNVPVDSILGRLEPNSRKVVEETFGHSLVLTLDEMIQMFTERALSSQVENTGAEGGVAIVMDVRTGAILALANDPGFDLNHFNKATSQQRANRALTHPIQIGSVMKIFTTTILLDNDLISTNELVDCQNGSARIKGKRLNDSHDLGIVPFYTAFAESSNIAMATLADRMEPIVQYEGLRRFGFGQKTGIELNGESRGVLNTVDKWSGISQNWLAIGYETSLTPIQVVQALAAIGNDGWRMKPYLVSELRSMEGRTLRKIEPVRMERVASRNTCRQMLGLLAQVVEHGTGGKAKMPGYQVGGKTGTARKQIRSGGENQREYYSAFAGLLPLDDPQLAIFVYLDDPKTSYYASKVAVPVFREIAEAAVHVLGIPPSDVDTWRMAQLSNEIQVDDGVETGRDDSPHDVQIPIPDDLLLPALPEDLDSDAPVAVKVMPDCMGKTMVDVYQLLDREGIEAQMLGSGILVRQQPAPGTTIPVNRKAVLVFSHPSDQHSKRTSKR